MQPTRVFIPELSKGAETWYIWIWNTFKPFYEMYRQFSRLEETMIRIMYYLCFLLGCEEISFSFLGRYRLFNCRDMYVEVFVDDLIEPPKGRPKRDFEVMINKISSEFLVISLYPLFGGIRLAPGSQPTLDIDIGQFKVIQIEPMYGSEPRLNIYLEWLQLREGLPQVTKIPINLVIPSYSTSPIGIIFSSTEGVWTKEQADVATKVLSAIYEQKRDEITGYVEKVSEFLDKIFRGLSIYLLY